jgi:hypothetical protein
METEMDKKVELMGQEEAVLTMVDALVALPIISIIHTMAVMAVVVKEAEAFPAMVAISKEAKDIVVEVIQIHLTYQFWNGNR